MTDTIRYENNPFTENMNVPVSRKNVRLSRLGKDDNILVNNETGEINGTHVTTYKKVDAEQFIKLFTANIALTFELKAAGIKAFNVLMWVMQEKGIDRDLIMLDKFALTDFLKANEDRKPPLKLSLSTFGRGLKELEKAQIIAKNIRYGWYYINPNFCFNGDRIAFSTIIEKSNNQASTEEQGELDLK